MSNVIVNVGAKKRGKTTGTKEMLNNFSGDKYIYDVNKEYKEYGKGAVFPDFEAFLETASKKVNTAIVFEEAFIFLSHQSQQKEIKEMLVRTRHTGNLIILNFHAVHQIPLFIWDYANFVIIRKTNDKLNYMLREYRDTDILEAWQTAIASPDPFKKVVIKMN